LTGKVKVLYLVSNPAKLDRLAVDEESRTVAARIRSSDYRDQIELIPAWAVRSDDLQHLLLRHGPQIVHFSGHGALGPATTTSSQTGPLPRRDMVAHRPQEREQLVLAGSSGDPHPIDIDVLVHLFSVLNEGLHLVLFNVCHSDSTARALADVVPCAIGMKHAISDEAAIAFAGAFYQALGFGRDLQAAFQLGKNALMTLSSPEDHTPRIYWRAGADNPARVVLVGPSRAAAPEQASLPPAVEVAPSCETATQNLLHLMWGLLDENLQDAFALAYNKKRRQGGNRISTKDLFQALSRLQDDAVKDLIASLPPESLPEPIDPVVTSEDRLVLAEDPLLSDCIAESLEHFKEIPALPRKLTTADLFVDIAKHGHGESVSRLRQHGIGEKEIEERVRKLGLVVLERPALEAG
jgi:hypothetical protein